VTDESAEGTGVLTVVATPIGNLDDVTLRALRVLREADLVLAEDTRRTRKLLTHHGISARLRALHAHSSPAVIERCLEDVRAGKALALVTDAGTPLLSDPGGMLVAAARQRGFQVQSAPGPSAVVAALTVCGLPFDAFRFAGFAPRSGKRRRQWLDAIATSPEASVFFEAPTRLAATLNELATRLPEERELAVCRELTKLHEEVVRGDAASLAERFSGGVRGEITVVVAAGPAAGAAEDAASQAPQLDSEIRSLLEQGHSPRDITRELTRRHGLPRRRVYAAVQALADGLSRS
jgi:16S rRNA (cytidine1402-2'-O)-methyltransferase